jgi:L-aminopeptidase/D-esterase-like protein
MTFPPKADAHSTFGDLCDVAGLRVGHYTDNRRPTGCTVVLCPEGAAAGVDVRGGAPGTRETDLLRPENSVDRVHAILLAAGSAFGLDAATGVMRWLEERGHGVRVGSACVPIVPAAVLFDLWVGDGRIRPDAEAGYAACEAASHGPIAQGCVGAGTGATVGKMLGADRAMKGGIGSASLRWGTYTVAALVAVNAVGDVVDEHGRILAGARCADGSQIEGCMNSLLQGAAVTAPLQTQAGSATTIGVVATDAPLTKTQASLLARLAHQGLARAIQPLTPHDGDTLFALSTQPGNDSSALDPGALSALGALAGEVVARAIRAGVQHARGLPEFGLPAAIDLADSRSVPLP